MEAVSEGVVEFVRGETAGFALLLILPCQPPARSTQVSSRLLANLSTCRLAEKFDHHVSKALHGIEVVAVAHMYGRIAQCGTERRTRMNEKH